MTTPKTPDDRTLEEKLERFKLQPYPDEPAYLQGDFEDLVEIIATAIEQSFKKGYEDGYDDALGAKDSATFPPAHLKSKEKL